MWRTASGILSGVSFHGYRLTCAFGARCTVSIATAYGCAGTSSGRTRIGVWQARTKSRVTVYTKSARARVHVGQEGLDHRHRDVGPAGAQLRAPALHVVGVGEVGHLRAVAAGLRRHGGDDAVTGPLAAGSR